MSQRFLAADAFGYAESLSDGQRAALLRLRETLDRVVRPVVAARWEAGTFPDEIVRPLIDLDLMDPEELRGTAGADSCLYTGFRSLELARVDASVATFYNAQAGLFRTTVLHGASPEQVERWDPLVRDHSLFGVFALTEPEHGSDIAGGLSTSARRDGDEWVIDGAKRWIGGALQSTHLAVFARDVADGQVKCFLVPTDADGVAMSKIEGKASLRIMQNAHITLEGVRVPDADRFGEVNSFADVGRLLRLMRSDVAWIATGVQLGAYEAAVAYVTRREQFGRPIGGFQLVQEKVATMLGNLTASLGICVQLARQQDAGVYRDENSALAKSWCAKKTRESVALAREVMGGNGILLEHDAMRFFADAEAVYSYEGTHEINSLIVGRAITGRGAFV